MKKLITLMLALAMLAMALPVLAEGSTASFLLSELEKQGVKIMVCMTSAERHGVAHDLSAGFLVLMEDVLKEIMNAGKIITL